MEQNVKVTFFLLVVELSPAKGSILKNYSTVQASMKCTFYKPQNVCALRTPFAMQYFHEVESLHLVRSE